MAACADLSLSLTGEEALVVCAGLRQKPGAAVDRELRKLRFTTEQLAIWLALG